MKRADGAAELLDGPLDPATLRGNLRDLTRINRWLGGVDLSRRAIRELAEAAWPQPAISVLDVGTGAADIPLDLLRTWGTWPALAVTALDIRSEVLDAARTLRPSWSERQASCWRSATVGRCRSTIERSTSPTRAWCSTISIRPTRSPSCASRRGLPVSAWW